MTQDVVPNVKTSGQEENPHPAVNVLENERSIVSQVPQLDNSSTQPEESLVHLNPDLITVRPEPQETLGPVQHDEGTDADTDTKNEPYFPLQALAKLDDMINKPRWVVPVLPDGELEILLKAAIRLSTKGLDNQSVPCQDFYREGLTLSFTKILTDDAVTTWKYDIQRYIMDNCKLLVDLCVSKLNEDNLVLLELLSIVFNPHCKFHAFNGNKSPDMTNLDESQIFAQQRDSRSSAKGWLVDLLNRFGKASGFAMLHSRFIEAPSKGRPLSFPVISALIRPFGLCHEVLTVETIKNYFIPVVNVVMEFLEGLSDEELKKESKTEAKNDALSAILKSMKALVLQVPGHEEKIQALEVFRLKIILRLLKISSFGGKMNALNEINKVLMNVSYSYQRHSSQSFDTEEWLTAEKMASWVQENRVLDIVLRDSLHQPQYVEKLEKIIRFMIKERALTTEDLDMIWRAHEGKHDAIVKNIHELLAKLAWDFSPEQLDYLFKCFQDSWHHANKKQREKLLELIRRLAEDDKEGVMAQKVLMLLWTLAKSDDCPTDTMDQALAALIKILDYSCSQDRDRHKMEWINRFVDELKRNNKWVVPAIKQIMEICKLFAEAPAAYGQPYSSNGRMNQLLYRNQVINELQSRHSIVMTVAINLVDYINATRVYYKENPQLTAENYMPDSRYPHTVQVQERLKFLRFLLKDGQLWLCAPQAKQIWNCLALNAVFPSDREACFKWFTKLMGEEPDLDPEITKEFFEDQILKLEPNLLTLNGMNCFERFFRNVNTKDPPRLIERRKNLVMDDLDLIGMDYLWRVVLLSSDAVAVKAICIMKELHANLGPKLQSQQERIHGDFIKDCFERLKTSFQTLQLLVDLKDSIQERQVEANRMIRVFDVLREYIHECDEAYNEERIRLPLSRASRGKVMSVIVRVQYTQPNRQDDIEIHTHSNESIGNLRQHILVQCKVTNSNVKVELYLDGELLDPRADKRILCRTTIKDKTLLSAKFSASSSNTASASGSSDESCPSPSPADDHEGGPNEETERCLPGVILSADVGYIPFLHRVCDLCNCSNPPLSKLYESARSLIDLSPPHLHTIEDIREMCKLKARHSQSSVQHTGPGLETKLFNNGKTKVSPSNACYTLEVLYTLMMPCSMSGVKHSADFIIIFIESGGISLILKALVHSDFMSDADIITKRNAYLLVLKMAKILLLTAAYSKVYSVVVAMKQNQRPSDPVYSHAISLDEVLKFMPATTYDSHLRQLCQTVGQHLHAKTLKDLLDESVVKAIQRIIWSSASGSLDLLTNGAAQDMQQAIEKMSGDMEEDEESPNVQLACTGLEVLTLSVEHHLESLANIPKDKLWRDFIVDSLLICKNRLIRTTAQDQFFVIAQHTPKLFFITFLFTIEMDKVPIYAHQSRQYFGLLCNLLARTLQSQMLSNHESRLESEIKWLKKTKEDLLKLGDPSVTESLLEGHFGVARELIHPLPESLKYKHGCHAEGSNLILELMEDYLFQSSKLLINLKQGKILDIVQGNMTALCQTNNCRCAAFDLLVALCTGCAENLEATLQKLHELFYQDKGITLTEWEFLPPVGSRPVHGFVGLKNGGATCYMNSVLQQLYMIPELRKCILTLEGTVNELDISEDMQSDVQSFSSPPSYNQLYPERSPSIGDLVDAGNTSRQPVENADTTHSSEDGSEKSYNLGVLKQVQIVFAHLAYSKLQFYTPKGFWKQFRINGEQVNLREQHDAMEFFARLFDSCDEAIKTLGHSQLFNKVLGGSFADQKICKGCPHRYSQQQIFSFLPVDIRNHQNLKESLEQFVKGDLLEGANAYFCERCGKKVDTVKRMCVRKLPKMLAIQLKRFDYDYERECPIKFNDYFEFPRKLDMNPYTVYGLAKMEGSGDVYEDDDEVSYADQVTQYQLAGIVVHSGQASGGHYYSYIKHSDKWYKFDDGEVTECRMDDDEELKKECYGGEYTGEVYDHMLKRTSFRRQKRWWNAYILFYERIPHSNVTQSAEIPMNDTIKKFSNLSLDEELNIPLAIERIVRWQNLKFMHNRNQFSQEYFNFIRNLILCNESIILNYVNGHQVQLPVEKIEKISSTSVQLASQFLFNVAFHTKKTLRGSASDWAKAIVQHLRVNKRIRSWFAEKVLFSHPERFSEYLLECTSSDVRGAFAHIIVSLARFSRVDGVVPAPPHLCLYADTEISENGRTLSDHLIMAVLSLLRKQVSEHGRQIPQYFQLFQMYAALGVDERRQLLSLNVLETFIKVALDEGPGPTIKYQYPEFNKLYAVVSALVRCCDLSSECQTFGNQQLVSNPHAYPGQVLSPLQPGVSKLLFKNKAFVKKIVEDNITQEDSKPLLLYLCYENSRFSADLLSELLWQVAYTYTYEMRPYLDMLLNVLLLCDSWQEARIQKTLIGFSEDKEGLFDIIYRSKVNYQKRSYQCIKLIVSLISECEVARKVIYCDKTLCSKWTSSVEWFSDEMEKRSQTSSHQYAYNNWSSPQSNETSNGYFLERSDSAKMTLARAVELCSDEVLANSNELSLYSVDDPEDCADTQSKNVNTSSREIDSSDESSTTKSNFGDSSTNQGIK